MEKGIPDKSIKAGVEYAIGPANWRDIRSIRSVEKVCFPKDLWPLFDSIAVLTLPGVLRFKAVVREFLVGYVAVDVRRSKQEAWIATFGVLPEYRRLGIGSALLRSCEEQIEMPKMKLSVRASNAEAIRLYQKFGYQQADVWAAYYLDGENAYVMEKLL